jgi:hypothetical protein
MLGVPIRDADKEAWNCMEESGDCNVCKAMSMKHIRTMYIKAEIQYRTLLLNK